MSHYTSKDKRTVGFSIMASLFLIGYFLFWALGDVWICWIYVCFIAFPLFLVGFGTFLVGLMPLDRQRYYINGKEVSALYLMQNRKAIDTSKVKAERVSSGALYPTLVRINVLFFLVILWLISAPIGELIIARYPAVGNTFSQYNIPVCLLLPFIVLFFYLIGKILHFSNEKNN